MLCLGKLHKQGPVRLANIAVSLRFRQSVDLRAWHYFQPVLRVNLLRASTRCHSCSAIAVTVLLLTRSARAIARLESPLASAFTIRCRMAKGQRFCGVTLWLEMLSLAVMCLDYVHANR
jgi:hypothetical protein